MNKIDFLIQAVMWSFFVTIVFAVIIYVLAYNYNRINKKNKL